MIGPDGGGGGGRAQTRKFFVLKPETSGCSNPQLGCYQTHPKRVYAGYFISKLEHVGAIAWSDAWHTTDDGRRIVAALAA